MFTSFLCVSSAPVLFLLDLFITIYVCVIEVKEADVDVWERCHLHTPDACVLEAADFHRVWVMCLLVCVCVCVWVIAGDDHMQTHTFILLNANVVNDFKDDSSMQHGIPKNRVNIRQICSSWFMSNTHVHWRSWKQHCFRLAREKGGRGTGTTL